MNVLFESSDKVELIDVNKVVLNRDSWIICECDLLCQSKKYPTAISAERFSKIVQDGYSGMFEVVKISPNAIILDENQDDFDIDDSINKIRRVALTHYSKHLDLQEFNDIINYVLYEVETEFTNECNNVIITSIISHLATHISEHNAIDVGLDIIRKALNVDVIMYHTERQFDTEITFLRPGSYSVVNSVTPVDNISDYPLTNYYHRLKTNWSENSNFDTLKDVLLKAANNCPLSVTLLKHKNPSFDRWVKDNVEENKIYIRLIRL